MPGVNKSLATNAANAAGGMKLNASAMRGGSSFPFKTNKGSTRHASMVTTHSTNMMVKSFQVMGETMLAPCLFHTREHDCARNANDGADQDGRARKTHALANKHADHGEHSRDDVRG